MNTPDLVGRRQDYTAVWTGQTLIVFGGSELIASRPHCDQEGFTFGGEYQPSSDEWHPLPCPPDGTAPRMLHTAVWTGQEMLVWGGTGLIDPKHPDTSPATSVGLRMTKT
jgi:hypothetical protein